MMANSLLRIAARSLFQRGIATSAVRQGQVTAKSGGAISWEEIRDTHYPQLGNRDIVGFGVNGEATYIDEAEFPCPAVRFGENTPQVLALREKELGDWKSLSVAEKKELYRASFRQTFAEMTTPSGDWKSVWAATFLIMSLTGWFAVYFKLFVYSPLPSTMTEEWKEDMVKRMVTQNVGPVEGLSSQYDHENKKWK